jgi:hypothetical protein
MAPVYVTYVSSLKWWPAFMGTMLYAFPLFPSSMHASTPQSMPACSSTAAGGCVHVLSMCQATPYY